MSGLRMGDDRHIGPADTFQYVFDHDLAGSAANNQPSACRCRVLPDMTGVQVREI